MSRESIQAFGVDFYTETKSTLLKRIKSSIQQPYSYIVTPNVDHLAQLKVNPALRNAYCNAHLRICDSRILLLLLRSLGISLSEAIPGSDLTLDLLEWANQDQLSLVLIGSTEEECKRLRRLYPAITIYHHNPPMGFIERPDEVEECLQFIRLHPSELVFYAVGAPRQEILASSIHSHERHGMGFCIGASISFATGTIKRAPRWMQKMGLEWLHRMFSDPKRLVRRYFHDLLFIIPAYISERIRKINNYNSSPLGLHVNQRKNSRKDNDNSLSQAVYQTKQSKNLVTTVASQTKTQPSQSSFAWSIMHGTVDIYDKPQPNSEENINNTTNKNTNQSTPMRKIKDLEAASE